MTPSTPAHVRCAIYTRYPVPYRVNEQYSACQAYVASRHVEGWGLVRARYDEAGYTAETLLRPALQRLLVDIRADQIDVVVVYHPDRLTRRVIDFAELVKVFDGHGVTMASVTRPPRSVQTFYRGATP